MTREEILRRKQVMANAGISIPNMDSSWGPWWDNLWKKTITHVKDANYYGVPSFTNVVHRVWDKLTGNTTYEREPQPIGGIVRKTDQSVPAQVGQTLRNWKYFGDPIRDVTLMLMPGPDKAVKTTKNLVKAVPKLFTKETAKKVVEAVPKIVKKAPKVAADIAVGFGVGTAVDKASEKITGQTWGENVSDKMSNMVGFHVSPIFGDITNPGYYTGAPILKGTKYILTNTNYSIPYLTGNKFLRTKFRNGLKKLGVGNGVQNIRFSGGIREYLGNVLSKYSTFAPKPKIYTGNQLELARQRVLNNLEKNGISKNDYIRWITQSDDPNLLQLLNKSKTDLPASIGSSEVEVTMPVEDYLKYINPIEGKRAAFNTSTGTIYHQNTGFLNKMQENFPEVHDAHEFSHAIDWIVRHKVPNPNGTPGINVQLISPSEIVDALDESLVPVKVQGLNYKNISQDPNIQDYFKMSTELKARYEQVRNWLGITDERPLTLKEWNQAKRWYTSSVGDNSMQTFFKLVEDPEKFINWASNRYPTNLYGDVLGADVTKLNWSESPQAGKWYYDYKMDFNDELPGFLELLKEQAQQAGRVAPVEETTGLVSYATPMKKSMGQYTPSERPWVFDGKKTTLMRKDPELINAGDQAYGLAHNLGGWDRNVYKNIVKDQGKWETDYLESARSLMYDVKARLYKKLVKENGGKPLNAEEFTDALQDLKKSAFEEAFQKAHGGYYAQKGMLYFDPYNMTTDDLNNVIDILSKYYNGGKLYKRST